MHPLRTTENANTTENLSYYIFVSFLFICLAPHLNVIIIIQVDFHSMINSIHRAIGQFSAAHFPHEFPRSEGDADAE